MSPKLPAFVAENARNFGHTSHAMLVEIFMHAFGQLGEPVTPSLIALRMRLIQEEVNEELLPALEKYAQHQGTEHATEVLDAICDSIYVILGAAIALKLPYHAGFLEVHRSNMAKLGLDGKPIRRADGKVLKPDNWRPPQLFQLVSDWRKLQPDEEYREDGLRKGA